jgi:predicted DNA-binding transcriptional regulator AlpA
MRTKRFGDGTRYYDEHGFRVHPNSRRYHPAPCRGRGDHVNPHKLLDDPTIGREMCAAARQLATLAIAGAMAGLAVAPVDVAPKDMATDRVLGVDEAAELTGLSRDTLYRNKNLPFRVQKSAGRIGFSEAGIMKWIRAKTGPRTC